ncbi:MAG: hypothetical protein H6Q89_5068, partial [Myxococcaceae bacterium]|nr:hypothetical protein [Myxococcaceae bacterium]
MERGTKGGPKASQGLMPAALLLACLL